MKYLTYSTFASLLLLALMACEKKDYPRGQSEYEHHYYAVFVPNSNAAAAATRSQTTLLKLPVQFYSAYTRNYDAVAKYSVVTTGLTPAAVRGVDFDVVDKNGNVIPSTDTTYTIVFPQAKQAMDTIYLKMLNNTAPGARKFDVNILDNITDQFEVDNFSTAYKRTVTIN